MAIQIQLRRGTAAQWLEINPILAEGELGVEIDGGRFKLGDGLTAWDSLPYSSGEQGPPGETPSITAVPPLVYDPSTATISLTEIQRTFVEYRTITEAEASAKEISLVNPVTSPSNVALDIRGGAGAPFPGDDFEVVGQKVRWSGLSLDSLIEPGEKIRILYF